jgi:GABA(A) receptor-associated protein
MERLFLTFGEIDKLKEKYPGKIPIFVTKSSSARDIPDIPKHKFLAPNNITLGQFIWVIRKQIQLPPEKALFVFVNNTLPTTSSFLSELYSIHKSPDGALRMTYTSENTFGFNPSYSCSSAYSYASLLSLQHHQKELPQLEPLPP